jgi:hypothetical protein
VTLSVSAGSTPAETRLPASWGSLVEVGSHNATHGCAVQADEEELLFVCRLSRLSLNELAGI